MEGPRRQLSKLFGLTKNPDYYRQYQVQPVTTLADLPELIQQDVILTNKLLYLLNTPVERKLTNEFAVSTVPGGHVYRRHIEKTKKNRKPTSKFNVKNIERYCLTAGNPNSYRYSVATLIDESIEKGTEEIGLVLLKQGLDEDNYPVNNVVRKIKQGYLIYDDLENGQVRVAVQHTYRHQFPFYIGEFVEKDGTTGQTATIETHITDKRFTTAFPIKDKSTPKIRQLENPFRPVKRHSKELEDLQPNRSHLEEAELARKRAAEDEAELLKFAQSSQFTGTDG